MTAPHQTNKGVAGGLATLTAAGKLAQGLGAASQGALVADQAALTASAVGALTATAAAGAAPTKAEFDALLADVTSIRTKLNQAIVDEGAGRTTQNATLASLRTAGVIGT